MPLTHKPTIRPQNSTGSDNSSVGGFVLYGDRLKLCGRWVCACFSITARALMGGRDTFTIQEMAPSPKPPLFIYWDVVRVTSTRRASSFGQKKGASLALKMCALVLISLSQSLPMPPSPPSASRQTTPLPPALNPDGSLKDAKDIEWVNSPSDENAKLGPFGEEPSPLRSSNNTSNGIADRNSDTDTDKIVGPSPRRRRPNAGLKMKALLHGKRSQVRFVQLFL